MWSDAKSHSKGLRTELGGRPLPKTGYPLEQVKNRSKHTAKSLKHDPSWADCLVKQSNQHSAESVSKNQGP